MKQFCPNSFIKFLFLAFAIFGLQAVAFGTKLFSPQANSGMTGGNTYCQNVTANVLIYTYNTCNVGTGSLAGTPLTIKWYQNTSNSTSGGTVVSTTLVNCAQTASGNSIYQPSTANMGTLYYYCVITWSGTGTCNTSGSLTSAIATVVVSTTPDVITGNSIGCLGYTTTLSNIISGGTWTSSNNAIASISSSAGTVNALATGNVTISYTIGSCRATMPFSVSVNPAAITGTNTVCQNATTTLSNSTPSGTWSVDNVAIATVNASSPVGVTGIAAGSTTVTYTAPTGCFSVRPVTVNTAPGPILGPTAACLGSTASLSNAVAGGTWTSATTTRAAIDAATGVVTTVSIGASIISYTIGTCKSGMTFTISPVPATIGGAASAVCEGSTITFTNSVNGGTWSSSNTSIATVGATGAVRGVAAGSATITYLLGSCYVTRNVTVNAQPAAITGSTSACLGSAVSLANTVAGGTWSSATPAKATIDGAGVVTTVANGTTVISYTLGNCASNITFTTLIPPLAISGTNTVCQGSTRTYTNTAIGGTWSSSNTGVAQVNAATGVITGVTAGTATITYSTGCGTAATRAITVNVTPAAITGTANMCIGGASTLANTVSGGVWTSGTTAVASINAATGVVAPVGVGIATISYTIGSCAVGRGITVSTQPTAIAGESIICLPAAITLNDTITGGTWASSSTAVASVNPLTGIVSSLAPGTTNITYSTGCGIPVVKSMTVYSTAPAIAGSSALCTGTTASLTDAIPNGTWSSSNTAAATIDGSGTITAIAAGSTAISYAMGGGCVATSPITIYAQPTAITGTTPMCVGTAITLTNTVAGGVWSSSNTAIITVNASTGTTNALAAGTANITYASNICVATAPLTASTVPAAPASISGTTTLCAGTTTTLSNATPLGTWSSSDTSMALINPTTGMLSGNAAGVAIITYAVSNLCGISYTTQSATIAVNPTAAVTSAPNPCVNTSSSIVITGTPSATITYNVDGGTSINQVLTGGTATISTGTITAPHTYNLVDVHTATCTTAINTATTITPIPMIWIGGATGYETDWAQAANWSCGTVPDTNADVTIPAGTLYSPAMNAASIVSAKSLTIAAGATLQSNAGAILFISNSLTNNGIFDGDGSIGLKGTAMQAIKGKGRISNLQLDNNSGAAIDTGALLTITNTLTLTTGTLHTNDSLVINSDSASTARIAPIATGAAVAGKVQILQYIQGGYRRFRFVSHPFNSAISFSQLQKNVDITGVGGSANGFTSTLSNAPSAFRLDSYTGNSTIPYDPGWKPITKINALAADSNKMQRYQGIRLFFRGAKGQGLGYVFLYTPAAIVTSMAGNINQGTQHVTLIKGMDSTQDYNMIGNPYPSPVDLGTVLYNAKQAGKIVGNAFYLWMPSAGVAGQFLTVPLGIGAPIPYSVCANTCFQVRAAYDSAQITFTENDKTPTYATTLLKTTNDYNTLTIYDTAYHMWDMLRVQFNDKATDNEDNDYDAVKPLGSDFNFYSLASGTRKLAIDARPYKTGNAIPLGISSAYAQQLIIKADNITAAQAGTLYLHDKLLNKYVLLEQGTEYRFAITKEKETQGNDRFELAMKSADTLMATEALRLTLAPNPATDEISINYAASENVAVRILDVTGNSVFSNTITSQSNNTKVSLSHLPSGIYMVEVTTKNGKATQRLVKE